MKKIIAASAICIALFSTANYAQSASHDASKFCSLEAIQEDAGLKKNLKFSSDPIGLAVEASSDQVKVDELFQAYANEHHCSIYSISMMDLAKGLLKGSPDTLFGNKDNSDSEMQKMSKKFLLIEGDKAVCIKKLDLKLPVHVFHDKDEKPNL